MLELTGVTKRFGSRVVLHEVSLRLGAGEYVAVVGDSGIGKSTLLNIIAGLEPADAGRVQIDGLEITRLNDDVATRLRRERFGFVFQAFHVLPHLTVLQNVGLPLLLRVYPLRYPVFKLLRPLAGLCEGYIGECTYAIAAALGAHYGA